MLQYILSDQFGQHGESNKLYDNIQDFISKLQAENEAIQADNEALAKSNVSYEALIQEHERSIDKQVKIGSKHAPELARWDSLKQEVHKKERVAA